MKRVIVILGTMALLVVGLLFGDQASASAVPSKSNVTVITRNFPKGSYGRVTLEDTRGKKTQQDIIVRFDQEILSAVTLSTAKKVTFEIKDKWGKVVQIRQFLSAMYVPETVIMDGAKGGYTPIASLQGTSDGIKALLDNTSSIVDIVYALEIDGRVISFRYVALGVGGELDYKGVVKHSARVLVDNGKVVAKMSIDPKAYVTNGRLVLDNANSDVAVAFRVLVDNKLVRDKVTFAEAGQVLCDIAPVYKRTAVSVAYRVGDGPWVNISVKR